jgi:WD40 repeat protein
VSNLHIMDLASQKVVRSLPAIDGGIYALGITDDAERVAFVGRDRFAVVETASGERTDIEQYDDGVFMIPRQFSKLHFSKDGNKLVSLRYIYDIETGTETELSWTETDAKKPKRVSQVRIAPDLSYFVLVQKQRALFMIGEDGLPRSYGKADRVIVWDTETGAERELPITDSMTEGKRCVVDISPDSQQVAVACKGGIIRLFSARDGELLWSKVNQGYKNDPLGKHLIQASADPVEPLRFTLGLDQDADWLLSELDARALRFN